VKPQKGSGDVFYLWRMTPNDRWLAYDSAHCPILARDEIVPWEQVIPLPECQFYAEAKAEAERRNSTRPDEAQGDLGL